MSRFERHEPVKFRRNSLLKQVKVAVICGHVTLSYKYLITQFTVGYSTI